MKPAPTVAPVANADSLKRPREERVIELPEDGDLWHLTIVTSSSTRESQVQSQQLTQFLSDAPRLSSLAGQVKYHQFDARHWWSTQYASYDAKPLVLLQTERGEVIYKASAGNLPKNAEELADEMESAIWAHAENCGPDCQPSATRPASRIPELRKPSTNTWGLPIPLEAIALIVIAVLAGIAAIRARS